MAGKLRITLKLSKIGTSERQRRVLAGLGLRRRQQTVVRENTPSIQGMVKKIRFMLDVAEC
jgi:large subunit ribosomal protein L30